MQSKPSKVLFLLPYPLGLAPSQRFRVEMLLPLLDGEGIAYTLRPFLSSKTWDVLYKGGSIFSKVLGIIKGYFRRLCTVLIEAPDYEVIFIHREAAPMGPPVFEWYLAKVLKKKIIYDFDDAIWIPNTSAENKLVTIFKASGKIRLICQWSEVISAGNDYLCKFAADNNTARVVKMPTVVDTLSRYRSAKKQSSGGVNIGWTGSHSTLKYLDRIVPVLKELRKTTPFDFLVIADKKPALDINDWTFIPWSAASEIEDLQKIDIGLMPLEQDEWAEGKCGFKLIQYLALGIPAIASPVGVNKQIIEENVNGFLCADDTRWLNALKTLISDTELRQRFGEAGRKKIVEEYSIEGNKEKFLSLFQSGLPLVSRSQPVS